MSKFIPTKVDKDRYYYTKELLKQYDLGFIHLRQTIYDMTELGRSTVKMIEKSRSYYGYVLRMRNSRSKRIIIDLDDLLLFAIITAELAMIVSWVIWALER